MTAFKKLNPKDLQFDPVKKIGMEWMLITAGNAVKCNTMTASWGGTGFLWNKPVAFIFVRPQRFTYQFIEENSLFTCSFFDKEHHNKLQFCGSHSGRDTDKFAATGLKIMETAEGAYTFEEARLYLVCRKLYFQDIDPNGFIDSSVAKNYPEKDYHRMYIGEIISGSELFIKKTSAER
ncbi:MAG: flavin reductase [Bacteroidetes bacterium HGW-Bacteroidetes-11]|nr:MAG: flavin reductase [Bacteroidetes bacterium HGW-Bacteroidetes-11]